MIEVTRIVARLRACPVGRQGWREYEDACIEALTHLLVPPLRPPRIQSRTYSKIDRRDAVFANRDFAGDTNWAKLFQELGARLVPFEFKNYDTADIGKEEVLQTSHYLKCDTMGRLAIMCSNKEPGDGAHRTRNTIFSVDAKVILFVSTEQLVEMLYIKERGEDPTDLLLDLIEEFYLQHE